MSDREALAGAQRPWFTITAVDDDLTSRGARVRRRAIGSALTTTQPLLHAEREPQGRAYRDDVDLLDQARIAQLISARNQRVVERRKELLSTES